MGYGAVYAEKAKVFQAMRPLHPDDLVRGQYRGYRDEPGVAGNSDVETFWALRLHIDSWRWAGVPWYLYAGKYLVVSVAEVLMELKPPPQRLFDDSAPAAGRANCLRFRLSPNTAGALAARVERAGKEFVGDQRELYLCEEQPGVGFDGWRQAREFESQELGLGVPGITLTADELAGHARLDLTWRWRDDGRWLGKDFAVRIAPPESL
jgi:hypothetical protein